jgi:hypothetical protein
MYNTSKTPRNQGRNAEAAWQDAVIGFLLEFRLKRNML